MKIKKIMVLFLALFEMLEEELKLREKIGNIDLKIIRELKDLFFTLY